MVHAGASPIRACATLAIALAVGALAAAPSVVAQVPGSHGFAGDGGPAELAKLAFPTAVAVQSDGGFLIADSENHRVRRVGPDGIITTIAGTGHAAFTGDGGPAAAASLNVPGDVAVTPDGGYLIADTGNNRIRRVAPDGTITTVAGSGATGFAGDGGPASAAQLAAPQGVDMTPEGTIIISDTANNRVREVSLSGTIDTVAGDGTTGSRGDGGPATAASIDHPADVVATAHGFLIAEAGGSRVRAVTFGAVATIAGTGNPGFTGDLTGTVSGLAFPAGLSLQPDGGLLIADTDNQRIRRLRPRGTIVTLAGTGAAGVGSGAQALRAELAFPRGVAALDDGGFLIADTRADRIRRVFADGTTDVVVGGGPSQLLRAAAGRAARHRDPWRFALKDSRVTIRRGRPVSLCVQTNKQASVDVAAFKGRRRVGRKAKLDTGYTSKCRSVGLGGLKPGRYEVVATARHFGEGSQKDRLTLIVRR